MSKTPQYVQHQSGRPPSFKVVQRHPLFYVVINPESGRQICLPASRYRDSKHFDDGPPHHKEAVWARM